MKNKKTLLKIISALFACIFLFSALSFTVHAADGIDPPGDPDGDDTVTSDDPNAGEDPDTGENPPEEPGEGEEPADDPDSGALPDGTEPDDPAQDTQTASEPADEPGEDADDGGYDGGSRWEELEDADDSEVIAATAVEVPRMEVTDASLFSGIVMWLCVAVGIAVVVGVMVSRRTRRRGP